MLFLVFLLALFLVFPQALVQKLPPSKEAIRELPKSKLSALLADGSNEKKL